MAKHTPDDQRQEAEQRATDHHRQASEFFREFRRSGDDALVGRANEEVARADEWEDKARGPGRGEAGEAESGKRTWYEPGSVAEGDGILQFEEARQGGLFEELSKYAARAVSDKEHRTFDGARLAVKATTAPVKGAVAAGRTAGKTAHAAGKGVRRTAQAVDKGVRAAGKAAGKVAAAPAKGVARGGRAILNAARRHKAGLPRAGERAPHQTERADQAPKRSKGTPERNTRNTPSRAAKGRAKVPTKTRGRNRHREPER